MRSSSLHQGGTDDPRRQMLPLGSGFAVSANFPFCLEGYINANTGLNLDFVKNGSLTAGGFGSLLMPAHKITSG